MKSLRYSSGLDREKLSELVELATKLLGEIRQGSESSAKAAVGPGGYNWWWIRGIPVIDSIGVEATLPQKEVERLIAAVNKMPDVKAVMGPLELTPSDLGQEPTPDPWKVRTYFGAKKSPEPQPWLPGLAGHTHG